MGLFGKKKNNEAGYSACNIGCCSVQESNTNMTEESGEKLTVKVLGAGCSSCHQQFKIVEETVKNMGIDADVEYVTDLARVIGYGVMSVPAVVINGKVVSSGKVLKASEVEALLRKMK